MAANCSLNGSGSMQATTDAPAASAPCTANDPTPPTPMIVTTSPGVMRAALTADPQPVGTQQASRQARSSGMSDGIGTTEPRATVA